MILLVLLVLMAIQLPKTCNLRGIEDPFDSADFCYFTTVSWLLRSGLAPTKACQPEDFSEIPSRLAWSKGPQQVPF